MNISSGLVLSNHLFALLVRFGLLCFLSLRFEPLLFSSSCGINKVCLIVSYGSEWCNIRTWGSGNPDPAAVVGVGNCEWVCLVLKIALLTCRLPEMSHFTNDCCSQIADKSASSTGLLHESQVRHLFRLVKCVKTNGEQMISCCKLQLVCCKSCGNEHSAFVCHHGDLLPSLWVRGRGALFQTSEWPMSSDSNISVKHCRGKSGWLSGWREGTVRRLDFTPQDVYDPLQCDEV